MSEENIVYVGRNPPMTYVLAVLTAFKDKEAGSVTLKARGQAISTAVDAAEICRNRFLTDLQPPSIEIATEQLPSNGGGTRGVSSIAITLKRLGKTEARDAEAEAPPEEVEEAVPSPKADLSEIKGVGKATEEKLIEAGFTTVESVAASKPEELAEQSGISSKVAAKLIESAKDLKEPKR